MITSVQAAASKTRVEPPAGSATRNWFSATFGFGAPTRSAALSPLISPTPWEPKAAPWRGAEANQRALDLIRRPLGRTARIWAASPK